ncbi:MAG: hypothetical protein U9R44_00360 [Candidatus Omnitrophota bacterium]|nr:hypothetical protein [Candidatus Omnitrophota bacterium]
MKIAMLGSWNTDSGASIHAELVGRAWVEMGIDLRVFSFYRHSFHGTALTKTALEEENYVTRCFTVYGVPTPEMNTTPLLEEDYDIFVVQDLGMIPMTHLLDIFPQIKKKAKTINVIHDGELSEKPEFFHFDWDHVVCFDRRYYDFLKQGYPEGKLTIIPFPSYPYRPGDMEKARKELGLPMDRKIVLVFGGAADYSVNASLVLDRLADRYDIMLLLVTEIEKVLEDFERIKGKTKFELKIIERSPDMEMLYRYLYASDCMMYNKPSMPIIVVSSTVFQCMGAGTPILALDSNFTDSFNREVLKHVNFYELEENFIDIFEKDKKYQMQQKAIVDYLEQHSAMQVAERFIKLFESLLKKR